MSFLKEFKEDLSQAVNELVNEEEKELTNQAEEEDQMINTLDSEENSDIDIDVINDMLSEEKEEVSETEDITGDMDILQEIDKSEDTEETKAPETKEIEVLDSNKEDDVVPSDEVAEITKGTNISGNISSDGSINVYGKITGDISCKGKLVITGTVKGTSDAGEVFANSAKIEGDVKSEGSVKIGNGSVIIGNIYATSAVIGGAVKGDIDVNGPVIVDATAVVQGNIKSRSVQINNGAVIDGFCSQSYADVDYKSLFDDTFGISK